MATETAVDVVMPQMGVSVSEGTITRWLKQEGEQIEADEPLLEISTDKVDTEVPSPASGTLTQILVQEGQTVDVGTKLGQIGGSAGVEAPAAEPEPPAAAEETPAPATAEAAAEADAVSPAETPAPTAPEPSAAPPATQPAPSGNGKAFVSPVVARIAGEHGIDPSQVPGTGSGGRVTKKDILAFVESGGTQQQAPPAAAPEAPAPPAPEAPALAAQPEAPAPPAKPPAPAPVAAGDTQPGETIEPITAMRRGIAEHMRRSLDTSAHVTSAIEVDFSRIVAVRNKLKKEYQAAYGVNPTYLAFVAKASVETLRDYPYVNAEMRGDSIVTRNFVNLGIAVELAEGKGLIVPVIRNAEGLNLLGLARGIAEIAGKARNKQLVPDDVQGGTFTITNPGGYGTFHGTPVISQPQSAILGTYALVKRPWVVEDELRPGRDRDPGDDEHHAHVRPPPRGRRAGGTLSPRPARAARGLGRRRELARRGEHPGERRRDSLRLESRDQQRRIPVVAVTVVHPAQQLGLRAPTPPGRLVLEAAEGLQIAFACNHLLDTTRAESADQLVLETLDADVGRTAEHAPEPALLAGVAQPDDPFAVVLLRRATDCLRAADRHDLDAGCDEIEAELRRNRLEGDPVGDAFDEDHGHAGKLA